MMRDTQHLAASGSLPASPGLPSCSLSNALSRLASGYSFTYSHIFIAFYLFSIHRMRRRTDVNPTGTLKYLEPKTSYVTIEKRIIP